MKIVRTLLIYSFLLFCCVVGADESTIFDESRNRHIPVKLYKPSDQFDCSKAACPVVFLNAGYRMQHTDYSFIAEALSNIGYLVIAVAHELPNDPPLSKAGNLFETRKENWLRGTNTLIFLRHYFSHRIPNVDFDNVSLIGHSNGGDIAAMLAGQDNSWIKHLITLDHRRYPMPRYHQPRTLSLRATDYPADAGVLLTEDEERAHSSCSVTIDDAKHNDMSDFGPDWLKVKIVKEVTDFLENERYCGTLH